MPNRSVISTDQAPAAIGPYSQAIKTGNTVYLSGQIALVPATAEMNNSTMEAEIQQVFSNLSAVCEAAGGSVQQLVKINLYLTDLTHFSLVNNMMEQLLDTPYPARAAVGVASLPKGARIEAEGILVID